MICTLYKSFFCWYVERNNHAEDANESADNTMSDHCVASVGVDAQDDAEIDHWAPEDRHVVLVKLVNGI
jgi:hypothetical protein